MDRSTEQIIKQIAEIQLEAIQIAKKEHLTGIQLKRLFGHAITKDVDNVVNRLIDMYKQMIEYPELVSLLGRYQLNLCYKVLTDNKETWSIDNSQGVYGAFELLNQINKRYGK